MQQTEQEKIFANHVLDKELIYRIYRELLKVNNKNQAAQFKNRQRTWIDIFFKKDTQITNKHMKRCLTPLIIKEMQIKTTMKSSYQLG